jgi:hypothetical protein
MTYELTTHTLQGQKVKIKTNIQTLKEVWNILKEVNLDGIMTGNAVDFSFNEIIDNLLIKGTLSDFCNIITENLPKPIDELDLNDVVGIITLFFQNIAKPFQGLNIALSQPSRAVTTEPQET